jgi:hypothetical protein
MVVRKEAAKLKRRCSAQLHVVESRPMGGALVVMWLAQRPEQQGPSEAQASGPLEIRDPVVLHRSAKQLILLVRVLRLNPRADLPRRSASNKEHM